MPFEIPSDINEYLILIEKVLSDIDMGMGPPSSLKDQQSRRKLLAFHFQNLTSQEIKEKIVYLNCYFDDRKKVLSSYLDALRNYVFSPHPSNLENGERSDEVFEKINRIGEAVTQKITLIDAFKTELEGMEPTLIGIDYPGQQDIEDKIRKLTPKEAFDIRVSILTACGDYRAYLQKNTGEVTKRKIEIMDEIITELDNSPNEIINGDLIAVSRVLQREKKFLTKNQDPGLITFLKAAGVVGAFLLGLVGFGIGGYFAAKSAYEKLFLKGEIFVEKVESKFPGPKGGG